MEWEYVAWDSIVLKAPVLHISDIRIQAPQAFEDMRAFESFRDELGATLVSCRLPHDHLSESMFLERRGFRFIEMIYKPELDLCAYIPKFCCDLLEVSRADIKQDLPSLVELAGASFSHERFHMDPLLGPDLGNKRYQNWVKNAISNNNQEIYLVRDGDKLIAFFIIELLADKTCYWHLNAIAPGNQGQGYGKRAWLTMIQHAILAGSTKILTSVAVRNHRALNLYARLGFRFSYPMMTFHWVKQI